uniref:hypothetical protein n=1 Tax=Agathobacter sp. TaxID=2021311 RepID=UPI00405688A6
MFESRHLLHAMTDIDDNYVQSAENFRKTVDFKKKRINIRRWAAAAAIGIVLTGTAAYGAFEFVKQLHVRTYDSVEELMSRHNIEPWDSAIPIANGTFEENGFQELTPAESLIDILMAGEEAMEESYILEEKDTDSTWIRKLSGSVDAYGYYEAYDYAKLSDAFARQNLQFDMSYIEEHYPTIAGEYGCDYLYKDETKGKCLQYRMFSGYVNEKGNFVSVEYGVDNATENTDPYILFQDDANVRYYITKDGVSVFLRQGIGTNGGTLISAEVYTEHGHLYIGMYGTFETEEVETILDSLKIADGMGIEKS